MSGALRGVDSDGVDQKHFLFKTTVEYILDKFKHQEMTSVKSHGGISVSSFWMFRKSGLKTTKLVSAKYLKLPGSWEENQEKGILALAKWDECRMK